MENLDAATVAQNAQKLGLLAEAQIQEAWDELGQRGGEPLPFLLIMERKGYLTPYQSQKLARGDTDGLIIGGYRVLYKIASGSFGRVYRAEDPATGRVVAIKVLRRRWSEDQNRIELFEREGKVGLSLRHPNIVEIITVNKEANGQWYIVMDFVEGGNLREILAIRKQLQPAEALRIIEEAAAGLAYAYSKGVTHRDMKLTNVLISTHGTAKLVDFGLAGIFTTAGLLADDKRKEERTVDYAGLERATAVKTGDVRSDIYFLGCVLYETLTGRSPLAMSRDRHQRMQKQRFDNVQPMGKDEVQGPRSLFHLVETMMSLDALQRYQTPSQLLDAIRAVRKEVEQKAGGNRSAEPPSVFLVEKDERLQEAIRDKLKEIGYRVNLSADAERALDRYRHKPYDAIIMDVGTVGDDATFPFDMIVREAERKERKFAAIVIFAPEQSHLTDQILSRPFIAPMVRPVTLRQLHHKLQELVPLEEKQA